DGVKCPLWLTTSTMRPGRPTWKVGPTVGSSAHPAQARPSGRALPRSLDSIDYQEFARSPGRRQFQAELLLHRHRESRGRVRRARRVVGRQIEVDVVAALQPRLVDDRTIEKGQDELDELVDRLARRLDPGAGGDEAAATRRLELGRDVLREVD